MQSFKEIEDSYEKPDPWGYQSNAEDEKRKRVLIAVATLFGPFERCLDIGAGEGWVTQHYPAKQIHGYELSNKAASRFPSNVQRVVVPTGKYDLICATGIFYGHYNWPFFIQLIKNHASKYLLISSIDSWEIKEVETLGREMFRAEYPYREWKQRTRIFLANP